MANSYYVNCQDSLKIESNKWSTELNVNPFNGDLSLNNSINQIKLRYFYADKYALRLAFALNYNQDNVNADYIYGTNPYDMSDRRKSFSLGINIGTERHFRGSKRLSPYIGWEIGVGYKATSQNIKNDDVEVDIKGAWIESVRYTSPQGGYYYSETMTERGYFNVGANMVAGFDFYIYKNLYLGYELTFGLNYKSYRDIEVEYTGTPTPTNNNYPERDDESWAIGPHLLNGIRLGYSF